MQLQTPVLFLIFNRPDTTNRVFDELRKAQPAKLYVAADGARKDKNGEAQLCTNTREILNKVDWKCDVKTLFRSENLGCKIAVSSAIDWFFENEEQGIILEDDCLPNPSFFRFCTTLLDHFKHDEKVMHIGGTNFQNGKQRGDGTYYFSKYNHIWGWATWKRAWKQYDVAMKQFPDFVKNKKTETIFDTQKEIKYWNKIFQSVYDGKVNTWDYQWTFAIWNQNALAVVPNKNLVSNIGFSDEATHTSSHSPLANLPSEEIAEITHPGFILQNKEADKFTLNVFYPSLISYAKQRVLKFIKKQI